MSTSISPATTNGATPRNSVKANSGLCVNVRLSAIRKMVGEAQKNGLLGAEEAANLTGVVGFPLPVEIR